MGLDPQAARFLEQTGAARRPPRRTLTPEQNRAASATPLPHLGERVTVAHVADTRVEGPGGAVPVRVYHPAIRTRLPVLVYLHGGGWVIGDLEFTDHVCRRFATLADCVVVSVDYRRAPEHPFPAALDDADAVVSAVATDPARFGADPARIAVGGESAGGNLAAVLAQRSRDVGPLLRHQLLVYPVLDTDTTTPQSYHQYATGYSMTREDMLYYFDCYLGGQDGTDPRVAPSRAGDLAGLCPATVITAECDILRDEGEAYARALAGAGVPVHAHRFAGMFHPFFPLAGALDAAREAQELAARCLRDAFVG